jgi:iron complex transport system substrate-binding protein
MIGGTNHCCARIVVVCCALVIAQYASAATNQITVIDDTGQTVSLATPAKRIVSLSPHITELLFEIGAGKKIVGAVEFSDYPEAARQLSRIGSANRLDMEKILSLEPDLVVAWHSGNSVQDIQAITRFGIPVFYSEPRKLDQIASNMSRLGKLTDNPELATAKAKAFQQKIALLRQQYGNERNVRAFFQLWHQPLMTVNGEHILNDLMVLCGATNVFVDLAALTPVVGREAVIRQRPDVIVATDVSVESLKSGWRSYPQIPAVQSGRLYVLSADLLHRQGPRLANGAEQLCRAINQVRQSQPE